MQKILSNSAPFLCSEIDFQTIDSQRFRTSSTAPAWQEHSSDCILQEYCKGGPILFQEQYRAMFNAIMSET